MASGAEAETLQVAGLALGTEMSEVHGAERDGVAGRQIPEVPPPPTPRRLEGLRKVGPKESSASL